jgi:hypothetical protein
MLQRITFTTLSISSMIVSWIFFYGFAQTYADPTSPYFAMYYLQYVGCGFAALSTLMGVALANLLQD